MIKTIFAAGSRAFSPALPAIIMLMLVSATSCSDDTLDNTVDDDEITEIEDAPEVVSNGEICTLNTANIASSMPDYVKQQVDTRFAVSSKTIDSSTKIVIASSAEIMSSGQKIRDAYDNGATIVLVNADNDAVNQWLDANGLSHSGDQIESADHDHLIYAFNNRHFYYFFDGFDEEDCEHEREFFPVRFDSVIGWLNRYATDGSPVMTHSRATRTDPVYDIASTFGYQVVTHNFAVELKDKTLGHVIASSADKLTRTSSIDVSFTICPLFSHDTNGSQGDYYIIQGYVNAHNAGMYKGKWTKKHGGVTSHLCGFYMSELKFNASVLNASVKFPVNGTPVPQTTASSTTYSSGFSWSIAGNITGGKVGGNPTATTSVTGTCTWNNTESRTLPDVSVKRDTGNGDIKWTYTFNNLPHTSGGSKHLDIPDLAVADFETNCTWIWWVPGAAPADVEKDYTAYIYIEPVYKSYHWYSSAADFSDKSYDDGVSAANKVFMFKLHHPERTLPEK